MYLFRSKKSDELEQSDTLSEEEEQSDTLSEEEEEEWIEVEGYKGLDANMQGWNGFQYELGKTYSTDKEIELCAENGFHFCLNLNDIQHYLYTWQARSRYFKVKAIVKKSDYEQYGNELNTFWPIPFNRVDKLIAKEITLLQELTIEEIYEKLNLKVSEEIFVEYYHSTVSFEDLLTRDFVNALTGKYSETFVLCLSNKIVKSFNSLSIVIPDREMALYKEFSDNKTKAIGLYEEGVSPDMRAYLLLQ